MIDTTPELNRIIHAARTEATRKVKEKGDNTGVDVQAYQRTVGLAPGSPWCAAFVAWAVMKGTGLPRAPRWCAGSASGMWGNALARLTAEAGLSNYIAVPGQETKIKPGWIWVRVKNPEEKALVSRGARPKGHTGIVVTPFAPARTNFTAVEGNTNEAGSRDGDGVYNKVQSFSDPRILGYFDPVALTLSYLNEEQLAALLARRSGPRTA